MLVSSSQVLDLMGERITASINMLSWKKSEEARMGQFTAPGINLETSS